MVEIALLLVGSKMFSTIDGRSNACGVGWMGVKMIDRLSARTKSKAQKNGSRAPRTSGADTKNRDGADYSIRKIRPVSTNT